MSEKIKELIAMVRDESAPLAWRLAAAEWLCEKLLGEAP